MKVEDYSDQLEEEFAWRTEEILFFQNQCSVIEQDELRDKFRRALVLLLYSNFEGFCNFSFSLYVAAINQEGIECKEANFAIAAASMSDVFASLRDGTKKAKEFINDNPDDTKLHRFARDREFIERAFEIMGRKISIPENVVNMESNLKPVVLRKNLYRLGLPHDQFSTLEPEISKLLELRNKIAHGETKLGVSEKLYEQLRSSALHVMTEITSGLTKAFSEKWFLATKTEAGAMVAN